MSDFFNINTGGATTETESVGGGFQQPETDVYGFKVKQAFADKYASGAKFISVTIELENGSEHTERFLMANAKGEGFWTDKNGKNQEYPGVTRFNELMFVAGIDSYAGLGMAQGRIKAWDSSAKAFTLQSADQVLHALKDVEGLVALEKVIENKQAKGDKGYYKTNEEEENVYIRKFATKDKVTKLEAAQKVEPPVYMDAWKEKHAGKTRNLFKAQTNAPKVGMPPAAGAATEDLF